VREFLEVLTNPGLLLGGLAEEPLGDDVGHVLAHDPHLLEPGPDPADVLGDELELRVVEEALLQPGDEPQPHVLAGLADFTEVVQIEDLVLVGSAPQVVEKLVNDQEQAVVGVLLVEEPHELGQVVLVALHLVVGREVERDALARQVILEPSADDLAQAGLGGRDLQSDDLELPGDGLGLVGDRLATDMPEQVGGLGQARDQRQQVALAGSVIADDEQPLVVGGREELEIRDEQFVQLLGHAIRDHERLDQLPHGVGRVGLLQLDDRLDGLELDQLGILHGSPVLISVHSLVRWDDQGIDPLGWEEFGMPRFGVGQRPVPVSAAPGGHDSPVAARSLEQPQGIEGQTRIEEDLQVVKQHDVARHLGENVLEEAFDLARPLPLGQSEHPPRQFEIHVDVREAIFSRQRTQHLRLPGAHRPGEEHEAVVPACRIGYRFGKSLDG
jgi:hypothetical protein